MKKLEFDWPVLKTPLIIFLASLLASMVLFVPSQWFRGNMEQSYEKENKRLKDISKRYIDGSEQQEIIDKLLPRFMGYYQRGIIGEEQRLNWVEILKDASRKNKIPSLQYNIASQEPFNATEGIDTGAFQIYTSLMKLRLGMLDEYDLDGLMVELDKRAAGMYSVKNCSFKRKDSNKIEYTSLQETITTECDLLWYTLRLADGTEIKP